MTLTDTAAVAGWVVYGAVLWWIGWREQMRPARGTRARVDAGIGLLAWLCGVRGRVQTVHVPMAVLQLAGILIAAVGPAYVMASLPDRRWQLLAIVLNVICALAYAAAEIVMWVRERRRRGPA